MTAEEFRKMALRKKKSLQAALVFAWRDRAPAHLVEEFDAE